MKQLSIAIPAYNSEKFIEIGLNSFLYSDKTMDPRLELIIINDGSKDGTLNVANAWKERFPDNIKVVDKPNGGHGSGINAGIDNAGGRYYKVIDSDDWIVTENLKTILDNLEGTEADVVVTNYHTVNMASNVIIGYEAGQSVREISMAELAAEKGELLAAQQFHGLMYNTAFYRNLGIRMSEGVFFEDQEYAIIPFIYAETVLLLPYYLYEYQIGNQQQSVNFENQAKRSGHFLTVIKKIVECRENSEMKPENDDFVSWRIGNSVTSYYATVLVKGKDKAQGKVLAAELKAYLHEKAPEIEAATDKKYSMMLKLGKIPGAASLYGKLFNSSLFSKFKKIWVK